MWTKYNKSLYSVLAWWGVSAVNTPYNVELKCSWSALNYSIPDLALVGRPVGGAGPYLEIYTVKQPGPKKSDGPNWSKSTFGVQSCQNTQVCPAWQVQVLSHLQSDELQLIWLCCCSLLASQVCVLSALLCGRILRAVLKVWASQKSVCRNDVSVYMWFIDSDRAVTLWCADVCFSVSVCVCSFVCLCVPKSVCVTFHCSIILVTCSQQC